MENCFLFMVSAEISGFLGEFDGLFVWGEPPKMRVKASDGQQNVDIPTKRTHSLPVVSGYRNR